MTTFSGFSFEELCSAAGLAQSSISRLALWMEARGIVSFSSVCASSTVASSAPNMPSRRPLTVRLALLWRIGEGHFDLPAAETTIVGGFVQLPVEAGRADFEHIALSAEVRRVEERGRRSRYRFAVTVVHPLGVIDDQAQRCPPALDVQELAPDDGGRPVELGSKLTRKDRRTSDDGAGADGLVTVCGQGLRSSSVESLSGCLCQLVRPPLSQDRRTPRGRHHPPRSRGLRFGRPPCTGPRARASSGR